MTKYLSFHIHCILKKYIFAVQNQKEFMLIIDVKDGESIDRALKKYKKKYDRAGIIKQLRSRKHFTKPSITRRQEILKAVYKLETYGPNAR